MPLATPDVTIVLAVTDWDVEVTVYIEAAGVTRLAKQGEVDVQLQDVGEGTDWGVYHQTPYRATNASGKVRFNNSEYSWIQGFDPDWWNAWSSNRFRIYARPSGETVPALEKALFLSSTEWSDPLIQGLKRQALVIRPGGAAPHPLLYD